MQINKEADRLRQDIHAPHAMDVPWGWGNCKVYPCTQVNRAFVEQRRATVERIRAEFSLRRDAEHADEHKIDYDRYCMDCKDESVILNVILDEEGE
jgi:hypothetical protein